MAAWIRRTLPAQLVVKASAELQTIIVMDYFFYSLSRENRKTRANKNLSDKRLASDRKTAHLPIASFLEIALQLSD